MDSIRHFYSFFCSCDGCGCSGHSRLERTASERENSGRAEALQICAANPLADVLWATVILVSMIGGSRLHRAFARIAIGLLTSVATAQTRGVFVTPIPNVPLMAVVNTESSRILPNGTTLNQKTLSAIARDEHGRIFNEKRALVPTSETAPPPILVIHIYDPQTRTNTFIDPQGQVAWQNTLRRPPATVPPEVGSIPLTGNSPASPYVKEQDLGTRRMEGVDVHGIRDTQTIPAEASGGKDISVVDEYWYSEDLRLNMLVIHKDPRTGEQTTTVTQVSRSEPDPAIFEIPAGYKVTHPGTAQQ